MGEAIDRAEIVAMVDDAIEVFDRRGDDFGSAVVRVTDAILAVAFGELDRARALADAALPFAQRCGDRFSLSRVSYVRGMVADVEGDAPTAYRHIEDSLRLLDELGLHQAVTAQARLLGPLAERCDQPDLAAQWRSFVAHRGDGWTHYDGTVVAVGAQPRGHRRAGRRRHRTRRPRPPRRARVVPAPPASTPAWRSPSRASASSRRRATTHPRRPATTRAALAAALEAGDPAPMALALEGCAGSLRGPRRHGDVARRRRPPVVRDRDRAHAPRPGRRDRGPSPGRARRRPLRRRAHGRQRRSIAAACSNWPEGSRRMVHSSPT